MSNIEPMSLEDWCNNRSTGNSTDVEVMVPSSAAAAHLTRVCVIRFIGAANFPLYIESSTKRVHWVFLWISFTYVI